jgi:hypothetical protein
MRLFSDGSFYLSHSSSLAAEYLCDRDTTQQFRNTGVLLSTVIQMQICERDTRLYPCDLTVYDTCDDVCAWLHASVHNVAWMVDYFNTIEHKVVSLFKATPLTFEFRKAIVSHMPAFDSCDTTTDWLPLTPSQARTTYAENVKRLQYRRVHVPFWLAFDEPIKVTTSRETSQAVGSSPLLSDAELDLLLGPASIV